MSDGPSESLKQIAGEVYGKDDLSDADIRGAKARFQATAVETDGVLLELAIMEFVTRPANDGFDAGDIAEGLPVTARETYDLLEDLKRDGLVLQYGDQWRCAHP